MRRDPVVRHSGPIRTPVASRVSLVSLSWEPLPTHIPFPSPKVKLPFAALGCLSYFLLARDTWACLDFPLTLGVLGL